MAFPSNFSKLSLEERAIAVLRHGVHLSTLEEGYHHHLLYHVGFQYFELRYHPVLKKIESAERAEYERLHFYARELKELY